VKSLSVREEIHKVLGKSFGDELIARAYPRDQHAHVSLGATSQVLAVADTALVENREALKRNPRSPARYAFLIGCYILRNRLSEAKALAEDFEQTISALLSRLYHTLAF
jgi:hypothetical protein